LHASKIIADQIEGLNIATQPATINNNNYYNSTSSANINDLNSNNNSGNNYIDIASFSGQLGYVQNLSSDFVKVNQA